MSDPAEVELRAFVAEGKLELAAARAIEQYGSELLGFLHARARNDDLAAEAFSVTCEQLWRRFASFRWEASLRTWLYCLARNALVTLQRDPRRDPARNLPLSVLSSIEAVRRQSTEPYQRTETKQALRDLRDSLPAEDHELLLLRIDRRMSWKDIARTLAEDEPTDSVLTSRAAALRKRYERLKEQLRELAIERGILDDVQ
ncbi:MAG TPA: sigma-70 family RNA polymerase sigma factor [Kofleriaceae bacterium]|nr:sigma-70 family RNA polymerase sigma factor [Kofleriaceae bacterium]